MNVNHSMDKRTISVLTVGLYMQVLVFLLAIIIRDAVAVNSHHSTQKMDHCNPLSSNSTCPASFCCVKQVITYKDVSRQALGTTVCQPRRAIGQFCLQNTEGYMCDCSAGLVCKTRDSENYGICAPASSST